MTPTTGTGGTPGGIRVSVFRSGPWHRGYASTVRYGSGREGREGREGHEGHEGVVAGLLAAAAAETGASVGTPPARAMSRAYRELSDRYRANTATPGDGELTADHVQAYLAARLPATLAVTRAVLGEVALRRPDWRPGSVLDLGAGPGTATWAALAVFPGVTRAVLVERSALMIDVGRRLARRGGAPALGTATWQRTSVLTPPGDGADRADLTVAAYVLGELADGDRAAAVAAWWRATAAELVIIDAGTPAGFARIRAARSALVETGATITAPCPADDDCPMTAGDWCHFGQRVERSALHRAMKDGALGYEDEKYSYLVASRRPPAHAAGRVLRVPRARSGHVRLTVCEAPRQGDVVMPRQRDVVVSRSEKEAYRWARRASWGDAVPPGTGPR